MASQQDISRLENAFLAADAAGNTEDAQLFADELRRLAVRPAQDAPAQQAVPDSERSTAWPKNDGGDNYLSRSASGLSRLASAVSDAFKNRNAVYANVAQGATAGWFDEGAGKITSALTGNPYEEERKAFLDMGKGLPPALEDAANMIGTAGLGVTIGAVAPWTTGFLPGVGLGAAWSMADAAGRADPGNRIEAATDPAVPIMGAAWAGLAPVALRGGVEGFTRAKDLLSRLKGNPPNPYIGRGGSGAQAALRNSAEDMAVRFPNDPPINSSSPLGQQRGMAQAAAEVAASGGKPAGRLAAKGEEWISQGKSEIGDIAGTIGSRGTMMSAQGESALAGIEFGVKQRAAQLAKEGGGAVAKAEGMLAETGRKLSDEGEALISSVARKLAAGANNITKGDLKGIGRSYQDIGIAPASSTARRADVMASPTVASKRINPLLENPDVKDILKKQEKDILWGAGVGKPVPPNNLSRLHATLTDLSRAARDATDPTVAGRLSRIENEFRSALSDAVPGYADVSRAYGQGIGMKKAYELGYGFDTKKISREALDALPPDERAEAVAAMASRFQELIAPVGGQPMSGAKLASTVDRLTRRLSDAFGKDAEGFAASLVTGSQKVIAGKAATDAASRGLRSANMGKVAAKLSGIPNIDEIARLSTEGSKKLMAAKVAESAARRGLSAKSPKQLRELRDRLGIAYGGSVDESVISPLVSATDNMASGKSISSWAGKGISEIDDEFRGSVSSAFNGDSAAVNKITAAAEAALRKVQAGEIAGGKTKLIQPDVSATPMRTRVAQSTSGSLAGAQTRLGFNLAAAVAERLGLSSRKHTLEKIAAILTETDPKKIDMAIKAMMQDRSGQNLRPILNTQGENVRRALGG